MNTFLHPALLIFFPVCMGIVVFLIPERVKHIKEALALLTAGAAFTGSFILFLLHKPFSKVYELINAEYINISFSIHISSFTLFFMLILTFINLCTVLYSWKYMEGKNRKKEYYTFILITTGSGCGLLLSDNLILFFLFWEIVSFLLYFLITASDESENVVKTFVMLGFSDSCLFLGILFIWYMTKSFTISNITIPTGSWLSYCAFFLFLAAALIKTGAVPFHNWIPAAGTIAPAPVMALLPGSIAVLPGIYLLLMISLKMFTIAFPIKLLLLILGALTIISCGLMALIRNNLSLVLSYITMVQTGYMIIGISTMNPVCIAGGMFHLLNTSLYTSTLFLCSGAVEFKTKTQDPDKLGGLANILPVTFITFLISTLSISGIPPFNGFVSLWMIYQGLIDSAPSTGLFIYFFLIFSMTGSILILAAMMKALYSVFLGRTSRLTEKVKSPVPVLMQIPMVILSLICLFLGVNPSVPLKYLIDPAMNSMKIPTIKEKGIFNTPIIVIFIISGLVFGLIIYLAGSMRKKIKKNAAFSGTKTKKPTRIPGSTLYSTIRNMNPFKLFYTIQEMGYLDLYELCGKLCKTITSALKSGD